MFKLIIFVIIVLTSIKAEAEFIFISIKDCVYPLKGYTYVTNTEDGLFLKKGNKYYLVRNNWGITIKKSYVNSKYICKTPKWVIKKYIEEVTSSSK